MVAEGYLGAHDQGGVQIRKVGYDAASLTGEAFVDVALTPEGAAAAEAYARSKIGTPYDFEAILGFVVPFADLHENRHLICSAFMTLTAKAGGAFPFPLAKEAHTVSPLDLFFWFSGRTAIAV